MVEYEAMEKAIMCQVAGKLISALPEEERKKILEGSLEKTLQDIMKPWNVEKAIKDDVFKYMAEYIALPEVQTKIRIATQKSIDVLLDGIISSIVTATQDNIKSTYRNFIEPKKEDN